MFAPSAKNLTLDLSNTEESKRGGGGSPNVLLVQLRRHATECSFRCRQLWIVGRAVSCHGGVYGGTPMSGSDRLTVEMPTHPVLETLEVQRVSVELYVSLQPDLHGVCAML